MIANCRTPSSFGVHPGLIPALEIDRVGHVTLKHEFS